MIDLSRIPAGSRRDCLLFSLNKLSLFRTIYWVNWHDKQLRLPVWTKNILRGCLSEIVLNCLCTLGRKQLWDQVLVNFGLFFLLIQQLFLLFLRWSHDSTCFQIHFSLMGQLQYQAIYVLMEFLLLKFQAIYLMKFLVCLILCYLMTKELYYGVRLQHYSHDHYCLHDVYF